MDAGNLDGNLLHRHMHLFKSVLRQHLCYKSINCPCQYSEVTSGGLDNKFEILAAISQSEHFVRCVLFSFG